MTTTSLIHTSVNISTSQQVLTAWYASLINKLQCMWI